MCSNKDRGWEYLSSPNGSFDFNKYNDGSWGYEDSDGSGDYNAADGSWGHKNPDGSADYNGADGSWGHKNPDGSVDYNGADGSWGHIDSDGNGFYNGADGSTEYIEVNQNYVSHYDNDEGCSGGSNSGSDALANLAGTVIGSIAAIGIASYMAYKDNERADFEAKERLKIERETAKEKLRIERMLQKEKMRSEHLKQKEKNRKAAKEKQQFKKECNKNFVIKESISQERLNTTFDIANKKSRTVAFFLCLFLGSFGAHRFYVGKIKTAILYVFTLGLFGIGWFVDIILIITGNFKDKDGILL